jgi:hypothetical protein
MRFLHLTQVYMFESMFDIFDLSDPGTEESQSRVLIDREVEVCHRFLIGEALSCIA